MQEQINQLNKQVQDLTKQVVDLSAMLQISTMPYDLKEIIRNEVIKGTDITAPTRTETITGTPYELTLPINPNTLLVLKWRGKEYKLLAIEV